MWCVRAQYVQYIILFRPHIKMIRKFPLFSPNLHKWKRAWKIAILLFIYGGVYHHQKPNIWFGHQSSVCCYIVSVFSFFFFTAKTFELIKREKKTQRKINEKKNPKESRNTKQEQRPHFGDWTSVIMTIIQMIFPEIHQITNTFFAEHPEF